MPACVVKAVWRKHISAWKKILNSGTESLDDLLHTIKAAVSTDGNTFDITVSRHNMVERGLAQWQRQKKTSPVNQLKVVFLGEAGIDTGALRKEFLSGMIGGIEKRFFEGGRHGKRPKYSLSDLDKGHFKTVGEIMAASLAQGGPAPNFLALWCYKFLCSGSLELEDLNKADLGDDQYIDLISKVELATECTIKDLTEDILSCGYTGLIIPEKKDEISRLMRTLSSQFAGQSLVREAQIRNYRR
ncbi:G2/M phase-specific E3 ubiquitin-protein ligase [Brachyhypopomus gauderio]|uniref:G2/M phase-specific E3 ubiquitin-protein ligase n=1 Tax=Brachyhypopomus gauderio TaxID=698409 RepID=UPI004041E90C